MKAKPLLSGGESHPARQGNGIALQAKPILTEERVILQGKAMNGIALYAKLVLSGGESHLARQGYGIALQTLS